MAEYYPLISRAVAGLRTGKLEARQAIYERARQALIGQLRAMDPPVPEEAITRETAALDEAISRTEAEIAADNAAPVAPAPAKPALTSETKPPPRPVSVTGPVKPPPRISTAAPTLGGAKRDEPARQAPSVDATSDAPAIPVRPVLPPRPAARVGNGNGSRSAQVAAATPATAAPAVSPRPASPPRILPAAPAFPAAAALKVEPVEDDGPPQAARDLDAVTSEPGETTPAEEAVSDKVRDEPARPAAPRPSEERRSRAGAWIVAVAALAAIAVIAFAAWRLRDNPQQLARTPAPATTQAAPDKIVERADRTDQGNAGAPASDDATRTAKDTAAGSATTTSDATPRASASVSTTPGAAAPAGTQAPAQVDPSLPIAYKAAVLVDAPELPEKVKTYVGTVVWSVQNVPLGQGQPLGTAIQADVSIPEANMQLMMQIRRNTESQLPASHTIDLKFTLNPGSVLGTIKQVNVPQMRQQDMPTGDPLAGIPVTIADNYFLIGLMRGAAEDRNLDMMRSRGWFDIPLLLGNGKASKITFEKGASGDKIFNDVLAGWKNAQN